MKPFKNIAVIGLGNMGGGIAACLAKKGYSLFVYDSSPEKRAAFLDSAQPCESAEEAVRAGGAILLSLPNSEIVEATLRALPDGAAAEKVFLDLSTSFPLSTKALAEELAQKGAFLLDAPLLAGPDEAKAGTLTAMIGGDRTAFDRVSPLLADFCEKFDYVGASGSAHTMKIMMNFTGLMYALLLGQMFPLAEKTGLDPKALYELMNNDVFSNWMYRFYAPKMIDRSFTEAFSLKLGLKDLRYMKELYNAYGVPAFALDGGIELLERCVEEGRGDHDFSECAAAVYALLGLPASAEEKERIEWKNA